ncbi:MAG: hypothetical protein L3J45_02465 [Flavobacteriaceae bacterium]|nr:hypothetical protein [Flavobacteriaceae bacterium]
MKINLFKSILLVLLVPIFGFTSENTNGKYEKSTTIKKEFNVNADALLKIKNRYGNVDIASWDKDKIAITVVITVKGANEEAVERKLKDIYVEFEATSNEVSAKTIIEKSLSSWSWWRRYSKKLNYKINYTIKMPVTNNLDLTNDYGAIVIDRLKGATKINCDYGRFDIGELLNTSNQINADYVSSSSIGFINGGNIDTNYSKMNIDKANKINLNADYTSIQFENVNTLNFSCDYGSLSASNVETIIGNGDYVSLKIGQLSKELNISSDYGSLKVDNILKGFKLIKVNADYTSGMRFGFEKGSAFDFIIDMEYALFKYDDMALDFNKKIVKSTSKYYEGYFGKPNSGNAVNINVEYGSVSLYNN